MSIKYAILGFLSWSPMTGYELKKLFAGSTTLHWSGNNNQIYKALVELHRHGLVTLEVQHQDSHPPRKIYTITENGRSALKEWVLSAPEPPQIRNSFLVQLAWADCLDANELNSLLASYEAEITVQVAMARTQEHRNQESPQRTPRETYLWQIIAENQIAFYESELAWIRRLRRELLTI